MIAFIVFVVLLAALGAASWLGRTADSTDPDYALGRVINGSPAGWAGSLGGHTRP